MSANTSKNLKRSNPSVDAICRAVKRLHTSSPAYDQEPGSASTSDSEDRRHESSLEQHSSSGLELGTSGSLGDEQMDTDRQFSDTATALEAGPSGVAPGPSPGTARLRYRTRHRLAEATNAVAHDVPRGWPLSYLHQPQPQPHGPGRPEQAPQQLHGCATDRPALHQQRLGHHTADAAAVPGPQQLPEEAEVEMEVTAEGPHAADAGRVPPRLQPPPALMQPYTYRRRNAFIHQLPGLPPAAPLPVVPEGDDPAEPATPRREEEGLSTLSFTEDTIMYEDTNKLLRELHFERLTRLSIHDDDSAISDAVDAALGFS